MLEVENLRYSYRDEKKFQNKSKKRNKYKKLLFLGDAFEKTNDRILNLAKKVQSYSNKKYFIAFKPYPADIKKYHNLKKIHITEKIHYQIYSMNLIYLLYPDHLLRR